MLEALAWTRRTLSQQPRLSHDTLDLHHVPATLAKRTWDPRNPTIPLLALKKLQPPPPNDLRTRQAISVKGSGAFAPSPPDVGSDAQDLVLIDLHSGFAAMTSDTGQ